MFFWCSSYSETCREDIPDLPSIIWVFIINLHRSLYVYFNAPELPVAWSYFHYTIFPEQINYFYCSHIRELRKDDEQYLSVSQLHCCYLSSFKEVWIISAWTRQGFIREYSALDVRLHTLDFYFLNSKHGTLHRAAACHPGSFFVKWSWQQWLWGVNDSTWAGHSPACPMERSQLAWQ